MPLAPRAAIVGASVAGLASACALARSGWSVTVVERRPDLLEGGRAFLLQPNGLAALARLGALELVRERSTEVARVAFFEHGRGPTAVYRYGELDHPQAFALEIRPRELRRALATRAGELGAPEPRFYVEALDVARERDRVTGVICRGEDGAELELEADLLVGADGAGSRVRAALAIPVREFTRDRYLLGTVDVPRPVRDLEVHCGDGYANGVCPLPDGTYFWDRVTDGNRVAADRRDLSAWREVYERRVPWAARFLDGLDSWDRLTELVTRPFWTASRTKPGAVLVGDAAGVVHPHSAQGANLALEDAAALGDALAGGTGSGEALSAFARARQRKLRRYVLWSLMAAASLDGPNPAWRAARRSGWAWNRVGPMRREILRRQAGLA